MSKRVIVTENSSSKKFKEIPLSTAQFLKERIKIGDRTA